MNQKRDELTSEFNKLAARAAELRGTENADELITVTAKMRSIESELAVLDRQEGVAKVEVVTTAPATLGEEAIESRVFTKPIGSVVELDKRDIFQSGAFPLPSGASPYVGLDTTSGIAAIPTLPTSFVDLLPVVPTSSDVVRYFRQETFTNSATGNSTQLSALNKSDLTWSQQIAVLAKVGHYMVVSKETLSDDPAVAALINREGVRGVREKIESDLLAASNVAGSVASIVAGAQSETYASEEGVLVGIRQAKTKAELAGLPADFVVVTPAVREAIDLLAIPDNGGVGYFASGPSTLFGMRLITSYRLPTGVDALVGSTQAVTLRSKSGVTVETSDSHDDYFIKDGVAIKVTAQIAAQNVRPSAFVKVSAAA
jgi:hypothetical protein